MAAQSGTYRLEFRDMRATGIVEGEAFRVLESSDARVFCQKSTQLKARLIRDRLLADGTFKSTGFDYYKLTRDYCFSSISLATNVLLGGNYNGFRYWKKTD